MVMAFVWAGIMLVLIAFFFGLPFYLHRHPEHRSASGGKASGMLGIGDELFHPDAYAARLALDEQQRLVEPAPTPDGDKGIGTDGKVHIDLRSAGS
jgi:hypothetical protein